MHMKRYGTLRQIKFSESAVATIQAAARKSHPLETGGILLGVHIGGEPWVTKAVEVATDQRGRTHFVIPANTVPALVLAAQREDPRLGYLGDWHSHPADVGASVTDRATMARLFRMLRSLHPPILVIARPRAEKHTLDVAQTGLCGLRSCDVLLTGDLPMAAVSPPADD
jgi:proteasome lid subunit RPN8/RPN11